MQQVIGAVGTQQVGQSSTEQLRRFTRRAITGGADLVAAVEGGDTPGETQACRRVLGADRQGAPAKQGIHRPAFRADRDGVPGPRQLGKEAVVAADLDRQRALAGIGQEVLGGEPLGGGVRQAETIQPRSGQHHRARARREHERALKALRRLSVAAPFTRFRGDWAVPFAREPSRTVREVSVTCGICRTRGGCHSVPLR
ncbi:hypothetical protein GCM10010177_35160 [Actinomadura citrea]|nr:hypothetical protein GCM10010177_35160 [Actinomadura citrea]